MFFTISPNSSTSWDGWIASVTVARIFPSLSTAAAANSTYILIVPFFPSAGAVEEEASLLHATPRVKDVPSNSCAYGSAAALATASLKSGMEIEQEAKSVSSVVTT